jgi:PmbA protein
MGPTSWRTHDDTRTGLDGPQDRAEYCASAERDETWRRVRAGRAVTDAGGAAGSVADTERLNELAESLIDRARPGEQLEVVVAASSSTSARAYDGDIESLTVADSAGLGVRVVVEGRVGFASAGTLDPDVALETLEEARDNLEFAIADPAVGLAVDDGVAPPSGLDLWSDEVAAMPVDDKLELAVRLEQRARELDPRVYGVRSASYGDRRSASVLATTSGLRAQDRATSASLAVTALASEGQDRQTGFASRVLRGPAGLDVEAVAAEAVLKATRLLGAVKPESGRVVLVLPPEVAASLVSIVGGMLGGDRVIKGRTPFADREGEVIAEPRLRLIDDPTDPESFGAGAHDGEGLATRRNVLVESGRLEGFLWDTVSAARAGRASTASAVRSTRSTPVVGWQALHVAPVSGDLESIVAGTDDGLLVQSMTGLHSGVNAVSGDFSVGVEGLMIRRGELAEPIREATIASTLPRMLAEIVAIGADVEHRPSGVSVPTIAVGGVALSGR